MLDTAINSAEDELEFMKAKETLQQVLQQMPPTTLVGAITYGSSVWVHELGFQEMSKSYALKGGKAHAPQSLAAQLGGVGYIRGCWL